MEGAGKGVKLTAVPLLVDWAATAAARAETVRMVKRILKYMFILVGKRRCGGRGDG